jgi:hypothetical protein
MDTQSTPTPQNGNADEESRGILQNGVSPHDAGTPTIPPGQVSSFEVALRNFNVDRTSDTRAQQLAAAVMRGMTAPFYKVISYLAPTTDDVLTAYDQLMTFADRCYAAVYNGPYPEEAPRALHFLMSVDMRRLQERESIRQSPPSAWLTLDQALHEAERAYTMLYVSLDYHIPEQWSSA